MNAFVKRRNLFITVNEKKFVKFIRTLVPVKVKNQLSPLNEAKSTTNEIFCGSDSSILEIIRKDLIVYEDFVSEQEEENLMKEIEPIFKRRRYQFDHWDGAIQGYKETEKETWQEENQIVINRIMKIAFPELLIPLKHVHVLDLSNTGHIKPHVDSVKFCGSVISGLSLLSTSVMRFAKENDSKSAAVDVLLKRRSLYVMKGIVRYQFTHEILGEGHSTFKSNPVQRNRRISVICRSMPEDQNNSEA